jgi:hypothetical protein
LHAYSFGPPQNWQLALALAIFRFGMVFSQQKMPPQLEAEKSIGIGDCGGRLSRFRLSFKGNPKNK